MPNTYFLVEAINITNNVFDTDQLSIIRGSSFLLKKAIETVSNDLKEHLEPISTGASSGLYLQKENSRLSDDDIKRKIILALSENEACLLLTFSVVHCKADDLLTAKELLITRLRIAQMQSISIATDPQKPCANQPCELDGRRLQSTDPNATRKVQGDDERRLSESLYQRLLKGRKLRSDYYFSELEKYKDELNLNSYHFSKDLESLASASDNNKLNNKIAIIYMDGNGFGAIQNNIVRENSGSNKTAIEAQISFDQTIQHKRTDFLKRLLQALTVNKEGKFPDAIACSKDEDKANKVIRLETLLWGGDEMTFVLPAWLGFEFIQFFFEFFADWKVEKVPLTHAMGAVFCSAKSPIGIMRNLAEELANNIKGQKGGRDANYWDYIILESIDYPSNNIISDYRKKRYQALGVNHFLPLPADKNWQRHKDSFIELTAESGLPHGQVYQIIHAIAEDKKQTTSTASTRITNTWENLSKRETKTTLKQEQQEQRLLQVGTPRLQQTIPKLAKGLFGIKNMDNPKQRALFWIHLIECWDYIAPR